MKTFSIKTAFKDGWELWKQHKKTITIATIIMILVKFIPDGERNFSVFVLVLIVAAFFIDMGWLKMLLRTVHGETPKVRDLIDHAHRVWKYLGVSLVFMLIVLIGLLLFIIPGIYLMYKYLFAPVLVLDKNMPIREALKESARMTTGVKWKLIGLSLVIILVDFLGLLFFVIGAVVAFPVSMLAFLVVYNKLSAPEIINESVPEIAPETGSKIALS